MEGVQEIKINGVWYEFVDGDAVYECRICELENKGAHLLNVCKLCASLSLGMRLIKKKEQDNGYRIKKNGNTLYY